MNITQNEHAVLRSLLTNYYTSHNGGIPDTYEAGDFAVWTHSIADAHEPYRGTPRSLPGIVSSLVKKGLVKSEGGGKDDCTYLTEAGYNEAIRLGPVKGE
jgi:hypothetical protein